MLSFEATVGAAVGEHKSGAVLSELRDSIGIREVKELKEMMCDDATFSALSSCYTNISLLDWARIRKFCKTNMSIFDQTEKGVVFLPNGDKIHLKSELSILKRIPVVNLAHDFFDSAPDPSGIQLIMNIVLLVDALMVGIALSLPATMSYDDALEAIKRFNGEGTGNELYNEWCVKSSFFESSMANYQCGWAMMNSFTEQATLSASLLGGSILCMVTLYTFFSVTNFTGPSQQSSHEMLEAWWKAILCATLLSIIMTSAGLMYMFGAVKMVATFNFPDFYLDSNGSYEYSDRLFDSRNTVNYYNTQTWTICTSSFVLALAVGSFSLRRKATAFKKAYSQGTNGSEHSTKSEFEMAYIQTSKTVPEIELPVERSAGKKDWDFYRSGDLGELVG